MDNSEKKKLANEKRLKAIREWQKNKNQSILKVSKESLGAVAFSPEKNNIKRFDSDHSPSFKNNQLKLFDSDGEEEDFSDCFKIRPQFEGKNGQRMLEMSTELSDRFKLDERFKDEEDPHDEEDVDNSETTKNIKILESVLGHEVSKKQLMAVNSRKKREIERFDPEDKNGTNCMKLIENVPKKTSKKKGKIESSFDSEKIPYSSERYVEVPSNLKEIMNSCSPFSFSDKFSSNDVKEVKVDEVKELNNIMVEKEPDKDKVSNYVTTGFQKADFEFRKHFKDPFFVSDSDDRLKEGIKFFVRPKPLDEIRKDWLMKRTRVLEIFKNRRKSALRSAKHPRRQNQRKQFTRRK